jgi:aryl-alcohol dehydrogenase-like predicted oxidoreductase
VLSNQLSLAEMLEPVWAGCLRADLAWHERTQTPLLAWSARARGYFSGRRRDREVRRSWQSRENEERRRRAEELALRLRVPTATVALAWVLAQRFPTLAVVGPRDGEELDACLAADALDLGPGDVDHLAGG